MEKKKSADKSNSHSSSIPILPLSSRKAGKSSTIKFPPIKQRLHILWDQAMIRYIWLDAVILTVFENPVLGQPLGGPSRILLILIKLDKGKGGPLGGGEGQRRWI